MSNKFEIQFNKLVKQAITKINEAGHPIIQFCGPISTGGFGDVLENLECLSEVIKETSQIGINTFDQLEFEKSFEEILEEHVGYDYPILEYFYKPILDEKVIDALFFLPNWQSSVGSKWEFNYAKNKGIPVIVLDNLLINTIKKEYSSLFKNKFLKQD